MKFKVLVFVALLAASLSIHAQTNSAIPSSVKATPNTPLTITTAPDGTVTIDSTDIMQFIPAKYRLFVLYLLGFSMVGGRLYHAFQTPGANVWTALQSTFQGKSLAVSNEIHQLKQKAGLPATPAPSQTAQTLSAPTTNNPPTSV